MRYHSYIFFDNDKAIHDIPDKKLQTYKKVFQKVITTRKDVITYSYSTLGLKQGTSIMFWFQADSIEAIQGLLNELMHTNLGKYLTITYTLFGMTRPTQYSSTSKTHELTERKGGKYLIIYPFTKKQSWYELSLNDRKELMKGHITIGRNYPQITQLLLYSYGVDDSEFIVSYETDDLPDFQKLVMDLRHDKVRAYTLKDTPIFTCIYKSLEEVMTFI